MLPWYILLSGDRGCCRTPEEKGAAVATCNLFFYNRVSSGPQEKTVCSSAGPFPLQQHFLLSPYPWRRNKVYGSQLWKGPQSCREVRQKASLWCLSSSSIFLIQKKEAVRTKSFPLYDFEYIAKRVDGTFWTWAISSTQTHVNTQTIVAIWPHCFLQRTEPHLSYRPKGRVWLHTGVWLYLKPTPSLSLEQGLSFSQETLLSWSYMHTLQEYLLSAVKHVHIEKHQNRSDAHKLIVSWKPCRFSRWKPSIV